MRSVMRTLLRHTETGLYFQGPEKWTPNPEVAYDFRFIARARQFVRSWQMDRVEVAFVFEDQQSISTVALEQVELEHAAQSSENPAGEGTPRLTARPLNIPWRES